MVLIRQQGEDSVTASFDGGLASMSVSSSLDEEDAAQGVQ